MGVPPVRYPADIMTCQGQPPIPKTFRMTRCEYNDVINAIITTYKALPHRCDESECLQSDFAGCVLRVAGHDFLDYNLASGTGGSDGCTDLAADNNKGLAACLHDGQFGLSLNQAYQPFCETISLADFFVIAAEAVMMATRRNAEDYAQVGSLNFEDTFKYGRETKSTCPEAGGQMPNPEDSCNGLDRVFLQNLGLNWRATAALSGAHTLGRARASQSGYEGWWSGPAESRKFNNQYFKNMVTRGWIARKDMFGNVAKNQWQRVDHEAAQGQHQMMLNTDLCLAYSGETADGGGVDTLQAATANCCAWTYAGDIVPEGEYVCGYSVVKEGAQQSCCAGAAYAPSCPNPEGTGGVAHEAVQEFAEDGGAWIATLKDAWVKATEKGHDDLKMLEVCYDDSTRVPGNLHFDCKAGEKYWERGWSELKRGFCCKNAGVGCELEFDCKGTPREMKSWNKKKKYHCCKEEFVGCELLFNCSEGVRNWHRGWSDYKKDFCCKKEGVGCVVLPAEDVQVKFDAGISKVWREPRLVATYGVPALLVASLLGVAAIKRRRSGAPLLTSEASGTDHDPEPCVQPEE